MITLLWIILFFVIMGFLSYKRASLPVWTLSIFFYLVVMSQFSTLGLAGKIIIWVIFALTASALNILPLRRALITKPIFALYQKIKPSMSSTEKEALAIGTVGWEGQLFAGMPDWKLWKSYPAPQLSLEEQAFLDEDVEQLCRMINNWEISHYLFNIPEPMWQFLKERGFFSLIIPKQYGGKEFSALAHSAIIAKVGGRSSAVATIIGVPNSLGPAELLLEYGTEEQKQYYLPRLACGEEIPSFALTAPDAGSDASAMPDRGIICKGNFKGEEIIGIRINWNKRYITLAPVATLLGLAFKLSDPDNLMGEQKELGITCALIPTNTPGIAIGRRHYPLSCAFPNGPTQGHNVFIPLDWIIGGPKMAGHGWQMLIERLSVGRAITLPSLATGGAKVAAFTMGAYARIRQQFHVGIGRFEGVEEALVRIAGNAYIMDATRLFAVSAIDRGERPAVPSSISKYHTTEMSRQMINDAMDISGGKGICMGPRNWLAQAYFEAPIAITVEGANILTRCMMIFGQGMMRCHPYLLKELMAAQNPDKKVALHDFDKALFAHIGFIISNKTRAWWLGMTGACFTFVPGDPALRRYYQHFTRFAAAFAYAADVSVLTLGADFKRSEYLSGRLGDVLSMIYMGCAVLKHFEDQGRPAEDLPLVEWSCQTLLFKLQNAFTAALYNFPKKGISAMLCCVIFPWGRHFKPPSDALAHRVNILFSNPTDTRARLTAGIYLTADENNMVGLVGEALSIVIAAETIESKLHAAIKAGQVSGQSTEEQITQAVAANILSAEDAILLQRAKDARAYIIAVDDFSAEELGVPGWHKEGGIAN